MRAVTALAATLLASAPVLAADFPILRGSQQPDYAPQLAGETNWEGVYVGAHAGYGGGRFGTFTTANSIVADQFRFTQLESEAAVSSWLRMKGGVSRGGVFGGFIGYNWQWGDTVLGLEADVSAITMRTTATETFGRLVGTSNGYLNNVNLTATSNAELNGYGTFRARAGWSAGWYMPFLTAGLAVGRGKYSTTVVSTLNATDADPGAAPVLPDVNRVYNTTAGNQNAWTLGYTAGAGVDMLLGGNVLLRGEYQFVAFGSIGSLPVHIHTARLGVGMKF